NSDVVLGGPAVSIMMENLGARPNVGIVTCNLVDADGAPQSLHRAFPTLPQVFFSWTGLGRRLDKWFLGNQSRRRYRLQRARRTGVCVIDQAAAACLMIRRATVGRIGGLFDERFPLFFNDVDLSRRVWEAGLEVHVLYDVSVTHYGSASLRQVPEGVRMLTFYESLERYYDLHEPRWKGRLLRLLVSADRPRLLRSDEPRGVLR